MVTRNVMLLFSRFLICLFIIGSTSGSNEKQSLPVLVLLPYPDPRDDSGWDRGLELLPAARLAVKEINNNSQILSGYEIQLIERGSDACGTSAIINGLTNFAGNALQWEPNATNAIAVIGLACSAVTASISPLAGREGVDLLQMAMSISETFRDKEMYRHLWRVLPSSAVFVTTTIALMEKFSWTRVAQVYDGNGVLFRTTANTFRKEITSNTSYTLLVDYAVGIGSSFFQSALDLIQDTGARIIFASMAMPEAAYLICEAAKRNLIWPGYVWVFYSRTFEEFINNAVCDLEILLPALENVTLLHIPLQGRDLDDVLVSGHTYREYLDAYNSEVAALSEEYEFQQYLSDFTFVNNPFANPMYDEVWSLALAINSSLPELEAKHLSLQDYEYNNIEITDIIEDHLKNVSFAGAVADISFTDNCETVTPVAIFHIRNNSTVKIGEYDGIQNNLSLWNISEESIPTDDFVVRYNLLNTVYAIYIYTVASLLFVFVTLMLCLMLGLHNTPHVRAMSPFLSLLIFLGCYQLLFASIFETIHQFIPQLDTTTYTALCFLEYWSSQNGVNLITATVLMRLVRIYHVFTHFGKTGKLWQDRYLFFLILLISCLPDLLIILRIIVNPVQYIEGATYLLTENPPVKVISTECSSEYKDIFDLITVAYAMLLVFLLLVFAILSRKIGRNNFKDTKKISIFVFSYIFISLTFQSIQRILHSLNRKHDAILVAALAQHLVVLLSQVFLIIPKVVPAFYHQLYKKDAKVSTRTSTGMLNSTLLLISSMKQK